MSYKTDRIRSLKKQIASRMADRGNLPARFPHPKDVARVSRYIEKDIAYLQHELQQLEGQ